ncbi:MAG TPA: flagellar biosynthetic protein FliO [Tepidisphaeraceae bacterium]|nr:flagellar biosynthetic protein FliO [Tepidisphaeraceae bacterium]
MRQLTLACFFLVLLMGISPWAGAEVEANAKAAAADPPVTLPHSALGDEAIRTHAAEAGRQGQSLPDIHTPNFEYGRVVGALCVVVGLIFFLKWCGKFFFPSAVGRSSTRVVEVLSRSVLAPRQQVMLLRVGRRVIVVADSGSQMSTLCEIGDPDEVAALVGQMRDEKHAAVAGFGSLFGRFRRKFDTVEEEAQAQTPPLQDEEPDGQTITSAREELSGLRDRVRLLAQQFND